MARGTEHDERRRDRASRALARGPRAAFTMIELLLVVVIVGGLLGLGLGVFANFDLRDHVAASRARSVLRAAHNWAVARSAHARVTIDRKAGTLRAEGLNVLGTWQFEALPLVGVSGAEGIANGVELIEDGFQGRALSFGPRDSSARVEFAVQHDPAYDFARGFQVRCAVRRQEGRGGTLLDCGGAFTLEFGGDGAVRATLSARREDDDAPAPAGTAAGGGRVLVSTAPDRVPAGRWTRVEASYDGRRFRLAVEGQLSAYVDESVRVAPLAGPLVLSPSRNAFAGDVDSLSISAVVADDALELPPGVQLSENTPAQVVFRAGGSLDPDVHREPVRFTIEYEDGRKDVVTVNLFGTVE